MATKTSRMWCRICDGFLRPRIAKSSPVYLWTGVNKQSHSTLLRQPNNLSSLLSEPSWSVRSLLPSSADLSVAPKVTPGQLRRLLRLSALPPPKSPEEEKQMLETLGSQLHFVKEIQKLNTDGIEPLKSIRDESPAADFEREIGLSELKAAFSSEDVNKKNRRVRRKNNGPSEESNDAENWNVLGHAERKVGRYFVVENGQEVIP